MLVGALAERRAGDAEEQREHHNLQDLVGRHRLDDRARHQVGDEILCRQRGDLEIGRGLGVGQRQVEVVAGAQDVDQHEAHEQRHQRRSHEPQHRLGADAADDLGIAHMGDADHERREHQRRNDHLDQAQEDVGHQRDVIGDAFRHRRIGPQRMAGIADRDAEQHADQNDGGERRTHGSLQSVSSGQV
jgi:hypothetical protein